MNLSPADLAKILAQPGYAVAPGSLWDTPECPQNAQEARRDDLGHPRASTHVSWQSERHFQAAVIAECDRRALLEPEYGMIFAVPNGQYRKGQMMEPGLRSGVCDLCVPLLRVSETEIYGACYLELKTGRNTLSPNQKVWIERLRMAGNFVEVVWDDLDKAMALLEWYLGLGR